MNQCDEEYHPGDVSREKEKNATQKIEILYYKVICLEFLL
jgi:hypothetical protein